MGYEGPYSLTQRCASEFVATWMFVFLLESVLANKLLPKTKGHEIGFGWVALGVGLACFLPVQYFGYISSMVNPAMALANCVAETIDWSDLLPIAVCQISGAFLGGATVWLFYLPHFATVPEPPPMKGTDELLRTRDYIGPSSLAYASYSTQVHPEVSTLSQGIEQFKKAIRGHSRPPRAFNEEDILGRHAVVGRSGVTRRRSINESDLHGRLQRYKVEDHAKASKSKSAKIPPTHTRASHHMSHPSTPVEEVNEPFVQWPMSSDEEDDPTEPLLANAPAPERKRMGGHHEETIVTIEDLAQSKPATGVHHDVSMKSLRALARHDTSTNLYYEPASEAGSEYFDSGISGDERSAPPITPFGVSNGVSILEPPHGMPERHRGHERKSLDHQKDEEEPSGEAKKEEKLDKAQRLHEASVRADQNAKLAVFATRPAMFVPICNLLNEVIGTMLLTSGILMLNQRGGMIWKGEDAVYMHGLKSFWVGILVVVLVLCLGGPGVALNPARDLGPRIAHWVLPIAGKGPSEWYYAWIPVLGTMIGGALGGVFYNLCDLLNDSTVHRGYYDNTLAQIAELREL